MTKFNVPQTTFWTIIFRKQFLTEDTLQNENYHDRVRKSRRRTDSFMIIIIIFVSSLE